MCPPGAAHPVAGRLAWWPATQLYVWRFRELAPSTARPMILCALVTVLLAGGVALLPRHLTGEDAALSVTR